MQIIIDVKTKFSHWEIDILRDVKLYNITSVIVRIRYDQQVLSYFDRTSNKYHNSSSHFMHVSIDLVKI